jgi:WD40 repeat protein
MRGKFLLTLTILFSFIFADVLKADKSDSSLQWKSIKTEHFRIYYHQGLENYAQRAGVLTEEIYPVMVKRIGWKPARRTDILLVDNIDMANGYATPFPYNKICIFVNRPEPNSGMSNFDEWFRLIFTHEFTHILNLDTVHDGPLLLRKIIGRACFPNLFQPIWIIEGNAVYNESLGGYGRNNSKYTDMIFRTAVGADGLRPMSHASSFPRAWPGGRVPYLYGAAFVQYLENEYGKGKMANVFHENAGCSLPYYDNTVPCIFPFLNTNAEKVYNRSFPVLWKEWQYKITLKFKKQIEAIKKIGVTSSNQISRENTNSTLPGFSNDGKSVYYIESSARSYSKLMRYDLSKKKSIELTRVNYPQSLSVVSDNLIYLSDIEFYRSFSIFYDAYIYFPGNYFQKTKGERINYIDGNKKGMVFLKKKSDHYTLYYEDKKSKKTIVLIKNSYIQLADIKLSNNNKYCVFTMKSDREKSDIAMISIESREVTRLTNDKYNNITPVFSSDDESIIFSSDKTDVYNLYEYNLKTGKVDRITNLLGGAFNPDNSHDGKKIVFASYGAKGHSISILDRPGKIYDTSEIKSEKLDSQFFLKKREIDSPKKKLYQPHEYSPIYSVFPSAYIPMIFSNEYFDDKFEYAFGILTMGWDVLQRHSYSLSASALSKQKRVELDLNYTYSRFYPDITFGYSDNKIFYGEDNFPFNEDSELDDKRELSRLGYISFFIPFIKFNYANLFQISYIYEKSFFDYAPPSSNGEYNSSEYNLSRVQLVYNFLGSHLYTYSVSNEDGFDFLIISDIYNKNINSDLSYYKTGIELKGYFPGLFYNNSIMTRLRTAYVSSGSNYDYYYTLGRYEKGSSGASPSGTDSWGLRGYPSGGVNGNTLAAATLEYRFPLFQSDIGYKTFPLLFRDLWLSIFTDYGNVWTNDLNCIDGEECIGIKDFKSSAGVELHLRITLGYQIDLTGYAGISQGFNEGAERQIYFAFTSISEIVLKKSIKRLNYL